MPYAADGATPMNMGTQCANVGVENQNTFVTVLRRYFRLAVRSVDWKYFGLGVHTSDPLLNVVKWIAYFTEVSSFDMRDVIVTFFFHRLVQLSLWSSSTSFFSSASALCTPALLRPSPSS